MAKITFPAHLVADVLPFVSTEKGRYHLQGILVRPELDGSLTLVATDGHRIVAVRVPADAVEMPSGAEQVIVQLDKDMVRAATQASREYHKRNAPSFLPLFTIDTDGGAASITKETGGAVSQENTLIDATYPNWDRCLPDVSRLVPGSCAGFNSSCMADFSKIGGAGKILSVFHVENNHNAPMLVKIPNRGDVLCVLAPCKSIEHAHLPFEINPQPLPSKQAAE